MIHEPLLVTDLSVVHCRYYRNKFDVTWDDDESRVSYHLDTYYVFDEEKSRPHGHPKNNTFITLNIPLLVRRMKIYYYDNIIILMF